MIWGYPYFRKPPLTHCTLKMFHKFPSRLQCLDASRPQLGDIDPQGEHSAPGDARGDARDGRSARDGNTSVAPSSSSMAAPWRHPVASPASSNQQQPATPLLAPTCWLASSGNFHALQPSDFTVALKLQFSLGLNWQDNHHLWLIWNQLATKEFFHPGGLVVSSLALPGVPWSRT